MIHQLTSKAIACVIPPDAEHVHIQDLRDWEFCFSYKHNGEWVHADLPHPGPTPWQILGVARNLSEEQWKGIVGKDERTVTNGTRDSLISGFKDYERHGGSSVFMVKRSATESGLSLLKSKGLNPETTLILLKS